MSKAHLTAISRKNPSLPMAWLSGQGKLNGKTLDYGCGKGFDAHHFDMDAYDPYHTDGLVVNQFIIDRGLEGIDLACCNDKYDTITCNYVLNVIETEEERNMVLSKIKRMLAEGGVAYITVRRDRQVQEGYTSKGTYQATVNLDLPIENEVKGRYTMYRLEK